MKAIILAAGRGSRLYPYTHDKPKCLLDIGNISILEQQINHIRDCGINEVVIVVGFGFERVEDFLRSYDGLGMRIKTLYNPFYQSTNSLVSLWIARSEFDEDIVVMNGDDVYEIGVLDKALSVRDEKICLPIKRKPRYDGEDMKVTVDGNRVSKISKSISKGETSAESVGIRVFRDRGVELLKRSVEEEMRNPGAENKWYISSIHRLISKGYEIRPLDIGNLYWMDVDCPLDLFRARKEADRFMRKEYGAPGLLRVVDSSE